MLTPSQMASADAAAVRAGTSSWSLMQQAGEAVFDVLRARFPEARKVDLLAGPGNNGGDAFVVADLLWKAGLEPVVYSADPGADPAADPGRDAGRAAAAFSGVVRPLAAFGSADGDLVVDGLYGAGLSRAVTGEAARAIKSANARGRPILAVDLPSGVSGQDGRTKGPAIRADVTVTFFRRKPGHLLQPGRSLCGDVVTADIGIDPRVLDEIRPTTFVNGPDLWGHRRPRPASDGHKFDRGHAVVFSGPATKTGAARLSAIAALRMGAGLVTLASPPSALLVNASHVTAVMLRRCEVPGDLDDLLADRRLNAFVLGPGFGIGEAARTAARAVIRAGRRLVLDADVISSFAEDPASLFASLGAGEASVVLTPHDGEFARLFPDLAADETLSKLDRARRASARSGAILILKGSDTVIARPDGQAAINETGTPYLATAGSGDVLSGLVAGLLAQGMPPFEAAAAGVWVHGRAAEHFGPGLIAEDLPHLVPRVLAELPD
ncbi:NAD(P)H-hydrate dehydratase [Aureimonas sp. Leaf454]|uniref:NAD(P)H-hydrate dehydratase n=1 Tax=Aureimonas sp. Leaf454 TaxID=1736381 RepID=UPI003298B57F